MVEKRSLYMGIQNEDTSLDYASQKGKHIGEN